MTLDLPTREQAQHLLTALREMWRQVGDRFGFDGAAGVQAQVLEEVERVEY